MVESESLPHPSDEKKATTDADPEVGASAPENVIDGQIIGPLGVPLHPQPTSDSLDPLNWTTFRKHVILAVVMYMYFMFTYITTTTVPSFPEVQEQFNITYEQMNWTIAIPALGLAVGPLIWSSMADIFGRRVVFILGTTIAFVATIGCAVANSYGGYMAARFFQGLGVSPASTVGMAVIGDMFFEHQRGAKIGLWVLAIDAGLLVGPIFGGFLDLVSHIWINWFTAILFGALLIFEVFFMTETLYPRQHMLSLQTHRDSPISSESEKAKVAAPTLNPDVSFPRTRVLPFLNYKPVPGMRHPTPWSTLVRFGLTWQYPTVVVAVMVFCFTWYWWLLCLITWIPAAYVQHSPQIQGLLFIGLLLGTLFSEVFMSGRLSDKVVARLALRNGGVRVAEMRLWLAYPAALLSAIGLILWGISIDKGYHWMVGQVAFFLFAAGIQMGNTVVSTYIVDCYPLQSMSVIVFYAVLLNLSAFLSPFFIAVWVEDDGLTWTFATQGMITFFVSVPALAAVQRWGPGLRAKAGQPSWVNPEYDVSLSA